MFKNKTTKCSPINIPCTKCGDSGAEINKVIASAKSEHPVLESGKKTIAIYVEKSAETVDSVNDSTQLQLCKDKLKTYRNGVFADYEYNVYEDSDSDGRSHFNAMLNDIEANKISMAVTFKIGTLCHSVCDFVNVLRTFKKHNVRLITASDSFRIYGDSSKLMMNMAVSPHITTTKKL